MRLLTTILMLLWLTALSAQGNWEVLKTGAGGWITGMDINAGDGLIVARSDVGGAYLYNAGTNNWKQLVTSASMPAADVHWNKYVGAQSIVSAPTNSNRLYMAYYESIYYSNDQGNTWIKSNIPTIDAAPNNDESKLAGERLAVDLVDPNIAFYGSINQGLWKTSNGVDWAQVNGIPSGATDRGIRSIVFDQNSTNANNTSTIYAAIDGEGIYQSVDAGATWAELPTAFFPNSSPIIMDMEMDSNGNLFVCGYDENAGGAQIPFGALRYSSSGWQQIFTEDLSIGMTELAINPDNPNQVFIFSDGFSDIYRSNTGQATNPSWEIMTMNVQADNIPWLVNMPQNWFTIGEVDFDRIQPNRIWISFGTGTYYSDDLADGNMTWVESSKGQEHLVSNDAITMPNGNILTAHWDFTLFMHDDQNKYPTQKLPSPRFNSSWDLDQSPTDPDFIVAVIEDHRYCCFDADTRSTGYSEDGGQTWTQFANMPGDPSDPHFGTIAVSANDNNNIVWVAAANRPPYYTLDKGQTWNAVTLPGNSGNCCLDGFFFKRRALVADRVLANTFYIYDWGAGHVFKTSNGGQSWIRHDAVLPAWSYNAKLLSVPGQAGHLYWVNGPEEAESLIEGLHFSDDGGQSWTELVNTNKVHNVAVGKSATTNGYPTLFIYGDVNGEEAYWQSDDQGISWTNIGLHPLGLYSWPSVLEGDPHRYGRLIAGFEGNGFITYNSLISLPIALVDFNVQKENLDSKLNWSTSQEFNSQRFDVERSFDSATWETLTSIATIGQANTYSYIDKNSLKNVLSNQPIYYRLKMVDQDGSFAYSPVKSIRGGKILAFDYYPNPVDDVLTITWSNDKNELAPLTISILDLYGRNVLQIESTMEKQVHQLSLVSLPVGAYYLKITSHEEIAVYPIIKQ